ncbi:MAG: hypothetical protein ABFS56_30170 [Pseudomonadota bacterium]
MLRYDQLHATANGVGAIAHILLGHVIWSLAPGLILGASVGIKKGNKFLRFMFLGTAALTAMPLS